MLAWLPCVPTGSRVRRGRYWLSQVIWFANGNGQQHRPHS